MEAQESPVGKILTKFHELESIYNINCGGCGVFALELSKVLSVLGVKHEIWGFDKPSITLFIAEEHKKYLHIMVKVGNGYWDAEGYFVEDEYGFVKEDGFVPHETFELEELVVAVNDEHLWNSSFDRFQIPKIKKNLNISANLL